jgi:hypothetical protein
LEHRLGRHRLNKDDAEGMTDGVVKLKGESLPTTEVLDHLRRVGPEQDLRLESFTGNTTANAFYEACGWSLAGPLDSSDLPKIEYVKHRG